MPAANHSADRERPRADPIRVIFCALAAAFASPTVYAGLVGLGLHFNIGLLALPAEALPIDTPLRLVALMPGSFIGFGLLARFRASRRQTLRRRLLAGTALGAVVGIINAPLTWLLMAGTTPPGLLVMVAIFGAPAGALCGAPIGLLVGFFCCPSRQADHRHAASRDNAL